MLNSLESEEKTMTKSLEGKVAVVTGSGQGVGRGIAIALAREGAKVVTNNRKPNSSTGLKDAGQLNEAERKKFLSLKGDAESVANEIIREGGAAVPFFGDISNYETAGKLIQTAVDKFGRIDILVNNAALLGTGNISDLTEIDWDNQMGPKLKGAFNCMNHAIPYMIKQKFGRIVNVSSDAWVGLASASAYSAANAGIVGLTKSVAKELVKMGITVNAICPQADSPGHFIEYTAMVKRLISMGVKIDEGKLKEVEKAHGPAEDMAPFIAYLSTEDASFISGSVFSVTADGRIDIYSEPVPHAQIKKNDAPWTVEELKSAVPNQLLKDYVSITTRNDWK
jgi:3-oxoacyl-[acyl-carrier protein] reductase